MRLDPVARARIIDRALSLSDVVEKTATAMRKAGSDADADTLLANMLELMRRLKDSLKRPESMTQESARQFAAQIDGMLSWFSDRMPVRKGRKADTATDDVEQESDDVEEDEDDGEIQKAVQRRLRGEIGEDALMRILGFKV